MPLHTLIQEIRIALRQLWKTPGFTGLAILTLALGIGANSTIFSWISATLLHPIPGVAQTDRMVTIERGERNEHPAPPLSYPDYVDLRDSTKSFAGLIAYHDDFMALTGAGKPQRIYGAAVSANYFDVLGVKATLGRTLLASRTDEAAGQAEVVLGYDLWRTRFAGDPTVIGRAVEINRHPYTVVGVAPRGFQGCKSGLRADVWTPLGMAQQIWGVRWIGERGVSWLNLLGTLRQGVDRRQADEELNLLMGRIAEQYATSHQGNNRMSTDPVWRSPFGANVYLAGMLPILMALAAVLLLLACANVANLLLVRSVARRREFAIRLSLGSSRWRLVRQLMAEVLLVAATGGTVALLVTLWTARILAAFLPPTTLPLTVNGQVDGTVLFVTVIVSIVTALAAGMVPALRAARLAPVAVLKDEALSTSGGLGRSRLTATLVVAQVALSTVLLTCAGLFVRSLEAVQRGDPGFDAGHVFLASYDLDPLGYSGTDGIAFDREVLVRVRALPGVRSATLADFSPLSFTIHSGAVLPEGYVPQAHEAMEADWGAVGPDYLQTLKTPLVAGRDFTADDKAGAQPVAIVNRAFADRYWPGQNGVGKRVAMRGGWWTVVGVAANGKYRRLVYDPTPLVLVPLWQSYRSEAILHLRVAGDPAAYSAAVERAVGGLNPDLPLFNETTLAANMQMGSVFERVAVDLAGVFGLLALLLATVGLYGVVAYTTKQRTHEIGIRMALGAERPVVFRQVLAQGLRLTVVGLTVGVAGSLVMAQFLRSMLFGVKTTDLATFVTVILLLCVVALAACYVPAWRATRIQPMTALRHE
jgi:predicted permease